MSSLVRLPGTAQGGAPPEPVLLCTIHTVGRARDCDLVLDDPQVSNHHARLSWNGWSWEVRDLSSRNGTWVDQRQVAPGVDHPVVDGAVVQFAADGPGFRLAFGGGPCAFARRADGVSVEGTVDLLPFDGATIIRTAGGWRIEQGDDTTPVASGDEVEIDGASWRLVLPGESVVSTVTAEPTLSDGLLDLVVSADEERVQARFTHRVGTFDLGERACLYLLATLARAAAIDRTSGLDDAEAGWRLRSELASGLRVSDAQIDLDVHRCRKLFHERGLRDVHRLIERQRGRLRIGVAAHVTTRR